MKTIKKLIIIFTALILPILLCSTVSAANYTVNPGDNIQNVINNATSGDNIIINSGTYNQNVTVNKNLTIKSNGTVTINASGTGSCFRIVSTGSGSTIQGFRLTGATVSTPLATAGIHLDGASYVNILQNTMFNNWAGIFMFPNARYNNIYENIITNNNRHGIRITDGSGYNNIYSNLITNNNLDNQANSGTTRYGGITYSTAATGNDNIYLNIIVGNLRNQLYDPDNTINAVNNWWGNNSLPTGISGATFNPWLVLNLTASQQVIYVNDSTVLNADLTKNSNNQDTKLIYPNKYIPDGVNILFSTDIGLLDGLSSVNKTTNQGKANVTYNGTTVGIANINATLNSQKVTTNVTVNSIPTGLVVSNVSGYFGDAVDLSANLRDLVHGNVPVPFKTVFFTVNGVLVGSALTDVNGVATLPYVINLVSGNYDIVANFAQDDYFNASSGNATLSVGLIPTSINVSNLTGNKGEIVNLTAKLIDTHNNVSLAGKTITYLLNGINVGNAVTDTNGVASLPYTITEMGGTYLIQALFAQDNTYAASSGEGKLKVPQADLYVKANSSKYNPLVGEIITITFNVGNKGPDSAENVVLTLNVPEGMAFIMARASFGDWKYDPSTRKITWNIGEVPEGASFNLSLMVKVTSSGIFEFKPGLISDTYDPNLENNIGSVVINSQNKADHGNSTAGMQKTGAPLMGILLALMALLGGLIISRRA